MNNLILLSNCNVLRAFYISFSLSLWFLTLYFVFFSRVLYFFCHLQSSYFTPFRIIFFLIYFFCSRVLHQTSNEQPKKNTHITYPPRLIHTHNKHKYMHIKCNYNKPPSTNDHSVILSVWIWSEILCHKYHAIECHCKKVYRHHR